jgi:PAS domain S-box-containing protein
MQERDFETAARRLAAIVEWSDDAIVSKDLNGIIRSWNRAAERMFGWTAAEAVGRSIRMIIPADRQAEEDMVLARMSRGESIDHFRTIRQRKDGTLFPISLTVSPVRNEAGEVIGISKIARDLTEQYQAEQELTRARTAQEDLQRRLMTLVAGSATLLISPRLEDVMPAALNLAIQLLDCDGCAIWRLTRGVWEIGACQGVSERFARRVISGTGSGAVAAVPFTDPLLAEDVQRSEMLAPYRPAYQEEGIASMMSVPLRIASELSGTLVLYYRTRHTFTEVEVETGRALGNLASAAITTAELYDAQRRSRSQSEFLAEAAAALGSSLDYNETLKRVAALAVPHFADWCAVDLEDDQGAIRRLAVAHVDPRRVELARSFQERFPEPPDEQSGVRGVIRSGTPVLVSEVTDDMLAANARGPEHLEAIRTIGIRSYMCVPLVVRDQPIGALSFVAAESGRRYTAADLRFAQDVAARAALAVENARAYAEVQRVNRLKDDFLATLSHELRTPLNAILGYARMLKSGMVPADRLPRAIEIVYKNASALTKIVEDVLDVSRIVSGKIRLKLQRIDLPPLVATSVETVQPAAEAKGVRLHSFVDPGTLQVAADPDRLQQVLWNLLSNAVKFTPAGGTVTVRLERINDHVEISVTDTGIGIAPAFLPHLFERFRQADSRFAREFGGLGLGLAIARHLVEMHGGTIAAASPGVGQGATFRVTLPVMAAHAMAISDPAERPSRGPATLDGLHILVVDDEDDALTMVRELLEQAGARVTTAMSGEEALDALERERPDLVLSDIGMPSMDGFELVRRLRGLPAISHVPVAALTAYARAEDRTRALRGGFQAHLAKPIDPDQLLTTICTLVGRGA